MSFDISRTQSIGNTCTRQHLYDLVATSTLSGSASGGDSSGLPATAATNPPTVPTDGNMIWWDMGHQVMKVPVNSVGSSACSMWMSIGPDSWEMPVCNVCADTLARGTVVSFSSNSAHGFYAVEPLKPMLAVSNTIIGYYTHMVHSSNLRGMCGVLQATAISGQIVPCVYRGFGYARVEGYAGLAAGNDKDRNWGHTAAMSTAYTGMLRTYIAGYHYLLTKKHPEFVGGILCHPTPGAACPDGTLLPCFIQFPWNAATYIHDDFNDTL
jgi:hypothetical protein